MQKCCSSGDVPVTLDELAHVNSSSDTSLCSSRSSRGFLAFVYTVLSWGGGGGWQWDFELKENNDDL